MCRIHLDSVLNAKCRHPVITDEKSKLFNANCRNDILLKHIKKRCDIHREEIVELSDEKGVVKHLRNYPFDYGIEHLKERETLILLKVDANYGDENESTTDKMIFVPMVSSMENDKEFMELINPKPQSRRSSAREDDRRGGGKGKGKQSAIKRTASKSGTKK
ncbi:hypothetical protein FSP39_015787 [Pinctada imbricata]|uniref:Uncharacterized protein n=1 Tax=Pinctada imbricata TaxID=66713 RepID=A0AA89BS41_PINIB|nr:hypothetical protein FSP39_015787 [Pinctada imbricata]